MRRKFLSVVLCVCMMLTMAPFAFAKGSDDTSTTNTQEQAPVANSSSSGSGGSTTSVSLPKDNTGNLTISTNNAVLDGSVDGSSNLTYTNGIITVNADNVTIKNLVFGDNAKLVVNTTGKFTLTGCTFAPTQVYNKATDTPVRTAVTLNVGEAVVTENTFKGVASGYYNAIEFGIGASNNDLSKATITGNTFNSAIQNNYFNFYNMTEGATIDIESNHFLLANKGSNAIRISNFKNVSGVAFNVNKNEYTYENASDNSIYEGFILLQDYSEGDTVQNFSGITINITNLTSPSNATQLFYVYDNQDGIITTNQPIVKGDSSIAKFFSARIGDTYYKTLEAALEAASTGNTVALLKDAHVASSISIAKAVTIDLQGKDISLSEDSTADLFTLASGANLTIKSTGDANGTISVPTTTYNAVVNVGNNSTFTLESGKVIGDYTVFAGKVTGATINVNGGSIEGNYGITAYGTGTLNDVIINVTGGEIKSTSQAAISTNGGSDKGGVNLTVTGGRIISEDGLGIYLPGINGKTTINNGTITAKTAAVEIRAGSLELNGGTYTATANTFTCDPNGSGSTTEGAAIAIAQHTTKKDITVTINNGTFVGVKALNESNPQNNDPAPQVNLSISNGNFNGEITTADVHNFITGGYFTSDPTSYLSTSPKAYTVASNKAGYSYMVTSQEPTKAPVIVKDDTDANLDSSITGDAKEAIENIIDKANIDGTAEAINEIGKAAILKDAAVTEEEQNNKNTKITIDVKVTVTATQANLSGNDSNSKSITFTATPVATVTVDTTQRKTDIKVDNSYLDGKEITVTLPLPADFIPAQIKHTSADGSVEYFLRDQKRGAKVFTYDVENHCAILKITKFSTFEVSGTQTYVEPSSGGSISTPTTYAVNVNAATNGAVAADKKTASKGTTVTVTASPSKGYVVDAVKVVDKDGKDVAVTGKDGKYVFTMPGSAVTVTGSFKAETPAPAALPFTDVKSGDWFYPAVQYAYAQGLMTGTSATTFAPNGTMNRAMIVTVLYRLEKSPAVTGASKFTDVPAGQWYSDAVAWAAANKIVNGYDETTFGPMNAVTREQMAAILFRYEQVKGLENVTLEENLNRFPDQNKISAYAIPALQWAVGQKIINGNADGTLDPTGTATRAQVAQIFTNLLNK